MELFAISHGKDVVDVIGSHSKMNGMAGDNGKEIVMQLCRIATDFVRTINKKTSKIILNRISENETDGSKLKFQQLFVKTKSVKNTQKSHDVVPIHLDVIKCRMSTGAKSKWTVFFLFIFQSELLFCLYQKLV